MGNNRWGSVMHDAGSLNLDAAVSLACGSPLPETTNVAATIVSPQSAPAPTANQIVNTPPVDIPVQQTTPVVVATPVLPTASIVEPQVTVAQFTTTKVRLNPPVVTRTVSSTRRFVTSKSQPTPSTIRRPIPTPEVVPPPPLPQFVPVDFGGGQDSGSDIDQYLNAHNIVRAQHGANPLVWSDNLASAATRWAQGCVFEHSGGILGRFGENLAAGTGSNYGIAAGIKSWTDEVSDYNPGNPIPSHYTQVVWQGTTQIGCSMVNCPGMLGAQFGNAKYIVCEYSPPGNVIGQFAQNVQ